MRLKDYFFASEHNDYKPWILTPAALGVFCLTIWLLRFLIPTLGLASPGIDATDLMNRINNERSQRFIPTLTTNSKLITAADGKAQDMLARSYFAHVDPDGNYVWPRIEAAGYKPYVTLGENLAMDFTSASAVVDAWMNSPTHRENILNPKFEDQGLVSVFGTYELGHDSNIEVSLFGTLYKTKVYPTPATKPAYATPYGTPYATPYPTPATKSPEAKTPKPAAPLITISPDVKITGGTAGDKKLINVDVVISGSPSLVTARLKSQSITLFAGQVKGEFIGKFTFDNTEDLSNAAVTVEARDQAGTKTTQDFPLNLPAVSSEQSPAQQVPIPTTNDAGIIKILRIIFGIFAAGYMGFLIVDAIIIHRAKIKRPGIHTNPHILVLFLVTIVSLFASKF